MADETELLEKGGRVVRDAGVGAAQAAGGIGSGLLKGLVAPFGNIGRGAWDSVLKYGLTIAGVTAAAGLVAPDYLRGFAEFFGKTDRLEKDAEGVEKNGVAHLAVMAGTAGLAGGAAIGVAKGVWQSVTGSGPESSEPSSGGERLGMAVGSIVTIGAVVAFTAGALKGNGVAHDKDAGDEVKAPAAPKAQAPQALDA